MCAAPKTPKISEHLNISPDVLAEALCIQALQKKLSLNSAKLSGRLGTSPALLATGASSATFDCAPCGAASTARASGIPLYPRPSLKQ
ncbi:unnamed protein product, partial [Prorocentrum cordatum]